MGSDFAPGFFEKRFDMTTKMSKLALAIGALVMAGGAMAADNATATVTAVVLTPISVAKDTDMVFGNVVAGNGIVTLSTVGGRTKSGSTVFSTSGATPAAAAFTVSGSDANTFSIAYTGSDSVLTNTTGTGNETMAIGWITEAVATTATGSTTVAQDATGTLASGSARIFSGAALTVGATQVAGSYAGVLKVTVAYN